MPRYLTSKGITSNVVTYIKDTLDLNFTTEYNSIPYLDFGCNTLIEDIREKEAKIILDTKIKEVINRINNRNGLGIQVQSIQILNGSQVQLELSVGDLILSKVL